MNRKTPASRIRSEAEADDVARRVEALLKSDPFSSADDAEVLELLNDLTEWVAHAHAHRHSEIEDALSPSPFERERSDAA